MNSGFYNAVKSACNGKVIKYYYDFEYLNLGNVKNDTKNLINFNLWGR